jgi:uncharacterized protein (TIGR03790 family)
VWYYRSTEGKKEEFSRITKKFSFLNFFPVNFLLHLDTPMRLFIKVLIATTMAITAGVPLAHGLEPAEVLVVANSKVPESLEIAKHYMDKRKIPPSHLVVVPVTDHETMSREEYDQVLKKAVLDTLAGPLADTRIAAVVLVYGIPLKVDPPVSTRAEKEELLRNLSLQANLTRESTSDEAEGRHKKAELAKSIDRIMKTDQKAAVDSELALAKAGSYDLAGWVSNPYFLGFQGIPPAVRKDLVLLVSRLDGPDPATVYRVIADTLQTERLGLQGKAYFDARWSRPEEGVGTDGYTRYDLSLHRAAEAVARRFTTVVDDRKELFAANSCPEAALYCGWYSLGRYIDSFVWQKGAIGYHIASAECVTLRDKRGSGWCLKMLEHGVAATIGPVHEPYVQGFPLPELFFASLIAGHMSLGEAYLVSLPYLSWQMVLVGDPLYQPFAPSR